MLPVLGAALVGALLMGRTKPKTRAVRKHILGPRTGQSYEVEDFEQAGFLVVIAADGSRAVFVRKSVREPGRPGFLWQHGRGNPQTLAAIHLDLCGKPPKQPQSPPPAEESHEPR